MTVLFIPPPAGVPPLGSLVRSFPFSAEQGAGLAALVYPTMTLGGLAFNTGMTDTNGVGWLVNQIDGWDYATLRETNTGRSHDDGIYNDPAFFGQRSLVLHGYVVSLSAQAVMAAREQLHAALNVTRSLTPFVVNESPPKMCMVRQAGGSKDAWVPDFGGMALQFQLALLAPDPRKYDPAPTVAGTTQPTGGSGVSWPLAWPLAWGAANTGGVVVATNNGTMESRPRISINGPCINPVIENRTTGQTLTFATQILGNETLTIDLASRAVLVDGTVPRRGAITSTPDQWWTLVPGPNEIHFSTGDGVNTGAAMSLSYSSAWI